MKDEIKEILDKWNKVCNNELEFVELTIEQMRLLLDYITNLQEENETLKGSSTSTKQWLYKQNKSRLKANLKLVEERDKYKTRNENAISETKLGIQVLEETKESYPMISCDVVINRYLKPILKSLGEDKDVED